MKYYATELEQNPTYTEMVVFQSDQCLPRYVVELMPNNPEKPLSLRNNYSFFHRKETLPVFAITQKVQDKEHKNQMQLLIRVAQYIYDKYLSKPFILKTSKGQDWTKMDWSYSSGESIIHRPNHGLAHTLRTVMYAPFVIDLFYEHNVYKLSSDQLKKLKSMLIDIQLMLLFFVTGRENDVGWRDDLENFMRFRKMSAEAFKKYVEETPGLKFKGSIDTYYAILDNMKEVIDKATTSSDLFTLALCDVVAACHDVDVMRCLKKEDFKNVLKGFDTKFGEERTRKMYNLAKNCIVQTGDRLIAEGNYFYNSKLFLDCSQDVHRCLTNIQHAIQRWEDTLNNSYHPTYGLSK